MNAPASEAARTAGRAPAAAPRIALCFFGITRSLSFTRASIEANVLGPARAAGEARVFAHFFRLERIENLRTKEAADIDPGEHRMLAPDELRLEAPGDCLARWEFERIAEHGDTWGDGFASVRNLVHQLHSLHVVTGMAAAWQPDLWIYARPDLRYHDSLAPILSRALAGPEETAWLPLWQARGGHNDRLAVLRGGRVARKYGARAERMHEFCAATAGPLHSERLLGFALAGERVRRIGTRATRVRAGGIDSWESFSFQPIERLHSRLEASRAPSPAKRAGHRALQELQRALELPFPR